MKIWMILDIVFVDEGGLQTLRRRHIYRVSEEWGKLLVKSQAGVEYVRV